MKDLHTCSHGSYHTFPESTWLTSHPGWAAWVSPPNERLTLWPFSLFPTSSLLPPLLSSTAIILWPDGTVFAWCGLYGSCATYTTLVPKTLGITTQESCQVQAATENQTAASVSPHQDTLETTSSTSPDTSPHPVPAAGHSNHLALISTLTTPITCSKATAKPQVFLPQEHQTQNQPFL